MYNCSKNPPKFFFFLKGLRPPCLPLKIWFSELSSEVLLLTLTETLGHLVCRLLLLPHRDLSRPRRPKPSPKAHCRGRPFMGFGPTRKVGETQALGQTRTLRSTPQMSWLLLIGARRSGWREGKPCPKFSDSVESLLLGEKIFIL